MPDRPRAAIRLLAASGLLLVLAGCGGRYVNDNIADPAEARRILAADKALCRQYAADTVPPTFQMDRYNPDPTIEAQAGQYVANTLEDDRRQDAFAACMRDRGWNIK